MRAYAANTYVPVERSRAEIDGLLSKNGATSVAILNDTESNVAAFAFTIKGARYRVELPLPVLADVTPARNKEPPGWWRLSVEQKQRKLDELLAQARKTRWRTMLLLLKSKLEIVRLGLSSVEREFMADMVLPSGKTAYEALAVVMRNGLDAADVMKALPAAASDE